MIRKWLQRSALAALVATSVWYGVREQHAVLQLSSSLRPLTMDERKRTLFAPWYAEVVALRQRVPPRGSIDLVMAGPGARDIAVLAGPLLHPRDTRYFDGWDAWRRRERALFFNDARAANAAPGPPPSPASITVAVDPAGRPQFRLVR